MGRDLAQKIDEHLNETAKVVQRGPKVTSLVARSSRSKVHVTVFFICVGFADVTHIWRESGAYVMLRAKFAYMYFDVRLHCIHVARVYS
jgi:hypothetical protein